MYSTIEGNVFEQFNLVVSYDVTRHPPFLVRKNAIDLHVTQVRDERIKTLSSTALYFNIHTRNDTSGTKSDEASCFYPNFLHRTCFIEHVGDDEKL